MLPRPKGGGDKVWPAPSVATALTKRGREANPAAES